MTLLKTIGRMVVRLKARL